jgi:hypothetical protein
MDRRVQEGDESLERRDADAGEPLSEAVRTEKDQRADRLLRERIADAGGVAPDEVELQLPELLARDHDVGELSEARRHAVNDAPFGDGTVDHGARRLDALHRLRRQRDAVSAARHGDDVLEGQALAGENNRLAHAV